MAPIERLEKLLVSASVRRLASGTQNPAGGYHIHPLTEMLDFVPELSLAWHHIFYNHFELRDSAMTGSTGRLLRIAGLVATLVAGVVVPRSVAAQQVARLDVQPREITVAVLDRFEVFAIAEDRTGNILFPTFQWVVADPAIAEVLEDEDAPGAAFIVGLSIGQTTVSVSVGNQTQRISVTVEGGLAVSGPVGTGQATIVQIDPATVYLMPAEDTQLLPRFLKDDGTPAAPEVVSWSSFRPDVATVDPTGRAVGIDEGTGLIEVTTRSGLSHRVQVHVSRVPWGFTRPVVALAPTESEAVEVVVPNQENRLVEPRYFIWQSTNPNVAVVTPLGVVTAIQGGETEIVATGFGEQRRIRVVVHKAVVGWIMRSLRGDTITIPIGGSAPFVVVGEAEDGTPVPEAPVSWTVGDTSIAVYGLVDDSSATGKDVGMTTLTASGEDGLIKQWVLNVVSAGLILDIDRAGLDINSQVTINASFADEFGNPVAPADRMIWTSTNPTVAQVSDGVVTPVGIGRVEIIGATPWGNADTAVVYVQGSLLFTLTRDGASDIYSAAPTEPGTVYPVIEFPSQETSPSFSPDGTRIAFVSDGSQNLEIYTAEADGSNPQRITQNTSADNNPVWTPDGQRIVYESVGPSGVSHIWIMHADGSSQRQLTQGDRSHRQPALSPTGQIAFTSDRAGKDDIWLMDLDGTNVRNFTATTDMLESMPSWLSDTAIVFLQEPDRRNQTTRAIMRMNFQREVNAITQMRLITSYALTSDGSLLAMVIPAPGPGGEPLGRLFVIPQGGGDIAEIVRQTDTDELSTPAFRP